MSAGHLTPVPITDRNGKQTTVRKNLQAASGKPAADIPAPSVVSPATLLQEKSTDQQLKNKILDLVVDLHGHGPDGIEKLTESLTAINDNDYLQRVLAVAETIAESDSFPEENSYARWKLAEGLKRRTPVEIAHRNLDLIRRGCKTGDGFTAVVQLHETIASRIQASGTGPVIIDRMDSHMSAYKTLRLSTVYADFTDASIYADDYAPLVSQYPNHCEQLCTFLIARGGANNFDADSFNEYLKTTASLAEGSL